MKVRHDIEPRMENVYRAIDLFAGIGGIRLGFENAFGSRIKFEWSNDINKYCAITYEANFQEALDTRDINTVVMDVSDIPDHDILLAGFPCQPFSMAGAKLGFEDKIRGTLFSAITKILQSKKPSAFLLENVAHFEKHDKGRTWNLVRDVLTNELGYRVFAKALNATNFGLPQKRVRFYMVGFKDHSLEFEFPRGSTEIPKLKDFLEKEVDDKYYLSQEYLTGLKRHRRRHESKGHGFGYIVLDPETDVANTLVVGGMGRERNLIPDKPLENAWKPGDTDLRKRNNEGVRKLTPREYANLQGFPSDFIIPVSNTQAYKQFGNSVPVNVIEAVASEMMRAFQGNVPKSKLTAYL